MRQAAHVTSRTGLKPIVRRPLDIHVIAPPPVTTTISDDVLRSQTRKFIMVRSEHWIVVKNHLQQRFKAIHFRIELVSQSVVYSWLLSKLGVPFVRCNDQA